MEYTIFLLQATQDRLVLHSNESVAGRARPIHPWEMELARTVNDGNNHREHHR